MKAFERKYGPEHYKFDYPEDMNMMIKYLEERGTLNITYGKLEELYREFSDEKFSAGWMNVELDILDLFSEWLENCDLGIR